MASAVGLALSWAPSASPQLLLSPRACLAHHGRDKQNCRNTCCPTRGSAGSPDTLPDLMTLPEPILEVRKLWPKRLSDLSQNMQSMRFLPTRPDVGTSFPEATHSSSNQPIALLCPVSQELPSGSYSLLSPSSSLPPADIGTGAVVICEGEGRNCCPLGSCHRLVITWNVLHISPL